MATRRAIVEGLALLHECYPTREISDKTAPVWTVVFADVDDTAFRKACVVACSQPGRTFFPSPGELRAIMLPPIDTTGLLQRIRECAGYNPGYGWRVPRVEQVRDQFGDAAAAAFGSVGPHRLFSDNETTASIAARDFSEAVTSEVQRSVNPAQSIAALKGTSLTAPQLPRLAP